MKVEIYKIVVANRKCQFMSVDERSGGYPSITANIEEALMYDEDDEEGLKKLQDYLADFSDKAHGGSNDLHSTLNNFKVVLIKMSFEI